MFVWRGSEFLFSPILSPTIKLVYRQRRVKKVLNVIMNGPFKFIQYFVVFKSKYIESNMYTIIKIVITKDHFNLFSATLNFSLVKINGLTFFNLPVLRAHKILGLQKGALSR